MLMVGMVLASVVFGSLLQDFGYKRLIQVVQGAAALTMLLNLIALWGQEPRRPGITNRAGPRPTFAQEWAALMANRTAPRLLAAVALGAAGFSMQDILLEPYGGEILGLGVGATTALTALMAGGSLAGFAVAGGALAKGRDPHWLAAMGGLVGLVGFSTIIFAAPLESALLFRTGVAIVGFGSGLFGVGMLTAAMALADGERTGLALGAWGAVQATAAGVAIAAGGAIRDVVGGLAMEGRLGVALMEPATGYSVVYHIEIALLFLMLVAIGPLVRRTAAAPARPFGLSEFPT
jgi:BCD family chlorophyll transporter-like MFS transporter